MEWLLSGLIAGLLITGTFKDREACEGKAVILREHKDVSDVKCTRLGNAAGITSGTLWLAPNGIDPNTQTWSGQSR